MNTSVYVRRHLFGDPTPSSPFETVTLSMKTKDFINKIRTKKTPQDDLLAYKMTEKKHNYRTKKSDAVFNPVKQQIMKIYGRVKSDTPSVVSENSESIKKRKKILPNPKKQKQKIKEPLKSIKKIASMKKKSKQK